MPLTATADGPFYNTSVITEREGSGEITFTRAGVVGTRIFAVPWAVKTTDPLTGAAAWITWLDYVLWFLGQTYMDNSGVMQVTAPDVFTNDLNWLICQEAHVKGEQMIGYEGDPNHPGIKGVPTARDYQPTPNNPPPPYTWTSDKNLPPTPGTGNATNITSLTTLTNNSPQIAPPAPGGYAWGLQAQPKAPEPSSGEEGKLYGTLPPAPSPQPGWPGQPGHPLKQFSPRIVYKTAIITCKYQAYTNSENMNITVQSVRRKGQHYGLTGHTDDTSNTAPADPTKNLNAGQWPVDPTATIDEDVGNMLSLGDFTFTKNQVLAPDFQQIMQLAGCVNKDTFLNWPPESVLFLGGRGKTSHLPNGTPVWDINFHFSIRMDPPTGTGLWERKFNYLKGQWEYLKTVGTAGNPGSQNLYPYLKADLSPLTVYR